MDKSQIPIPKSQFPVPANRLQILRVFGTLFLGAHLWAAWFPSESWNWGVWHLQYWPKGLREGFVLLGVAALWHSEELWELGRTFWESLPKVFRKWIVPVIGLGVVWLLRSRAYQGEVGMVQAEAMEEGNLNPAMYGVVVYRFLNGFINVIRGWYHVGHLTREDMKWMNSLGSILCGVGFYFLFKAIIKAWESEQENRGLLIGLIFSTGLASVFWGHGNDCAIIALALLGVIWSWGKSGFFERVGPWTYPLSGLLQGMAAAAHPFGALLFFPLGVGLLFLTGVVSPGPGEGWERWLRCRVAPWGVKLVFWQIVGIAAAFGFLFLYDYRNFVNFPVYCNNFSGNAFVPWFGVEVARPGVYRYVFFTWHHLANVLNHELLLSPFTLFGYVVFFPEILKAVKEKLGKVLLIAAFPYLVFSVRATSTRGVVMDWDIFSMPTLMLTVPLLYALGKSVAEDVRPCLRAMIVVQVVHLAPWIIWRAEGR